MDPVTAGLSCKSVLDPVNLSTNLYFLVARSPFKLTRKMPERQPALIRFL